MTAPGKAAAAAFASARLSVLDGARIKDLPARLEASGLDTRSLFQGKTQEELADLAPYLVAVDAASDFSQWTFGPGWGTSCAVHLVTSAPIDEVRGHLRHFLMVVDHTGKSFYFRFYDPRVLRVFLPTCDAEQLEALFGPIEAFIVEGADPAEALVFTREGEVLRTRTLPAKSTIQWKGRATA